jgi:hypothetical protein
MTVAAFVHKNYNNNNNNCAETKQKSTTTIMGEHLVSAVGGALTAALSHVTSFPLGSYSLPPSLVHTIYLNARK